MINIDDRLLTTVSEKEMWLLLHIAKRMNREGFCFPSNDTLMKDTKWSYPTLQKVKKTLKEKGIIGVQKRNSNGGLQTSNNYFVKTDMVGIFVNLKDKGVKNFNTPPVKNFNTPPVKNFNTPPVKNFNTPPVKNFNTPPVKNFNTPPVKNFNTEVLTNEVLTNEPFGATPKKTQNFSKENSAKGKNLNIKTLEKDVNRGFRDLREKAAKVGNLDTVKNEFLLHCEEKGFEYKSYYKTKSYLGDYLDQRIQENKTSEKIELVTNKAELTPAQRVGAIPLKLVYEIGAQPQFNFIPSDFVPILRWFEYLKSIDKQIKNALSMEQFLMNVQKTGIGNFGKLYKISIEKQYKAIYWDMDLPTDSNNWHPPVFKYD